ncbi:MAG: ECF transporter S component [Clostridia bacterium]|nr:ECF transporter S component [Clostridia bacterium]
MANRRRAVMMTAMLSAVSVILMYLEFPLPFFIPPFIKMDFSDLPALIAGFSMGPVSGVAVCLIKNLVHALASMSGGVGELANFILSGVFTAVASLAYAIRKTRKTALLGSVAGAFCMALVSVPMNLYVVYPIYYSLLAPEEAVLSAYQALLPVRSVAQALWVFNVPFTFAKGILCGALCFLVYKRLSGFIKGKS